MNYKGRNTSFILKPLTSGMKLNVIIDMQTREVTFEVVGAEGDQVLSSRFHHLRPPFFTIPCTIPAGALIPRRGEHPAGGGARRRLRPV